MIIIHAHLKYCINTLADVWKNDPRAVAFALEGSGGRGNDDQWSDGDVMVVVKDDSYADVHREMRELMEKYCGKIRMWLPEGEAERCVNYAFLFEKDDEQFLFDHSLFCESVIRETPSFEAGVIFFDKSGALTAANQRFTELKPNFDPSLLLGIIDTYLVYTYLNGKYFRRGDTAKLIYIQTTLQGLHMRLMQALYLDLRFTGWWCRDIYLLSEEHQRIILMYAVPPDCQKIATLIRPELNHFSTDARRICANLGMEYPKDGEAFVLRQLIDAGIPE